MKAVFKYALRPGGVTGLNLPAGARVLHADCQRNDFNLWALVDPNEKKTEPRDFLLVGTGHVVDDGLYDHVATFRVQDGNFVFHVFEKQGKMT